MTLLERLLQRQNPITVQRSWDGQFTITQGQRKATFQAVQNLQQGQTRRNGFS